MVSLEQLLSSRSRPPGPLASIPALAERMAWLVVPVAQTRDSGPAEQSNFDLALDALGGPGADVEIHRQRNWAVGWVEYILVRPDSPAARAAAEVERRLDGAPVLDEDDVARREHEAALEQWHDWGQDAFITAITRRLALDEDTVSALHDADDAHLRTLYERRADSGHEPGSLPAIAAAAAAVTAEDIADMLGNPDFMKPDFQRQAAPGRRPGGGHP